MKIRQLLVALIWAVVSQGVLAQTAKTINLTIGMYRIEAEVAATEAARELGLMNRSSMAPQAGMLFVFQKAEPYCFWMKNTLIPLSIAFINDAGEIVNIDDMKPQTETNHCAAKPVSYALEMNQGWFKSKGIKAGTKIGGIVAPAK